MIRKIIKPQQNQIILNIPENYINKEVELIIFPIKETIIEKNNNIMKNKKSLRGVFSKYADTSKVSLEGKAWQNYIINRVNQND